jgi:GT2 family glycosyltransferase
MSQETAPAAETPVLEHAERVRLALLRGVLATADWLAPKLARLLPRSKVEALDWQTGVSVLVPERGSPELVAEALASVREAARRIDEPVESIVIVNGCALELYAELRREFHDARFLHSPEPLGFASAVRRGVRAARHGAVYLLNSDMTLEPDALAELLKWRRPRVGAISSQIFFADRARRREETGWADMRIVDGTIEMFHADPEDQTMVRGHLYAGGGASLFQRGLLHELTSGRDAYHPFYFEDAEWGVRGWRMGYEMLFCPRSIAWHRHRATVSRYFQPAEIDRIVERNRIQFQLRNFPDSIEPSRALDAVARTDGRTRRELTSLTNLADLLQRRLKNALAPCADAPLTWTRQKFYPESGPARTGPCLLLVSPYVVFPPTHGGAVRMSRLIKELAAEHRVILLSDEQDGYSSASHRYFDGLEAIHLVGGRIERPHERVGRLPRIRTHSHGTLARELRRIVATYQPDVVQVEYMELGGLVAGGKHDRPWILSLHDVTLSEGNASEEDRVELELMHQHDALIACSPEDASLVAGRRVAVVPNGLTLTKQPYLSSSGNRAILFMGPFRYAPNLEGARILAARVYPELRRRVPAAELWLAGGRGGAEIAARYDEFDQPGVKIIDYVEDPRPLLDRSALTINPQYEIRGSSIKLVESLAAGRVCVSTVDGARGYRDAGFPGLLLVRRIEQMLEPLTWLLDDETARIALEKPVLELLLPHDWTHSAARLAELYQRCLEERRAG